jgi:LEA14-like dessication related protein
MSLKVLNKVGLFIGVSGVIAGLYLHYKQQIYYATQYCYKIAKIVPQSFSSSSIKFELILKILNRSLFNMVIKSYNLDIYIDGNYITNIRDSRENVIAANGVSLISSNIDIKPSNILVSSVILDLATKYLMDKKTIMINVKGHLSVKSSFITKTLPIQYSDNLYNLINSDKESTEKLVCPKNF